MEPAADTTTIDDSPLGAEEQLALALSAAPVRDALRLVTLIWGELGRIPQRCSDPLVARTRLEWWQRELERLTSGRPQHPATVALSKLGHHDALATQGPALINAMVREISGGGTSDETAFIAHLDARYGGYLNAVAPIIRPNAGVAGPESIPEGVRHRFGAASALMRLHSGDPVMLALLPRHQGADPAQRRLMTLTMLGNTLFLKDFAIPSGYPFIGATVALAVALAEARVEGRTLGPLRRLWVAWRSARGAR
jgi:Squalene/phytoene synthase